MTNFFGIYCDGDFDLNTEVYVTSELNGPPTIMNTELGTGPVYPSNVAGIGFVVWVHIAGGPRFMLSTSPTTYTSIVDSAGTLAMRGNFSVSLVKTGDIASGSVVDASLIPTVAWRVADKAGYTGLPMELYRTNYNGTLSFSTGTCTTPDVNVNLGSHSLDVELTNVGSYTEWVDSSFVLQNCPTFSGYHGDANRQTIYDSSDIAQGDSKNPNLLEVTFQPIYGVTDNVIHLQNDASSAQGIGIQIGASPSNLQANPLNPELIWDGSEIFTITPPTDSSFKIPLAARYYRYQEEAQAGSANSGVLVNIDYL
ncbi:fimbrial protein [Vibrio galatheae]|nr:hypothetical protein [Vibrio galatheae]